MIVECTYNLFSSINLMRKIDLEKFAKLKIPLCQMMPLCPITEVWQIMERDVLKLTLELRYGYWIGSATFYVVLTNKDDNDANNIFCGSDNRSDIDSDLYTLV